MLTGSCGLPLRAIALESILLLSFGITNRAPV
jgi:hypothetical protein